MTDWKERHNKNTMGKMVVLDRFNDCFFGMIIKGKWHYWDDKTESWATVGAEQFKWHFLPAREGEK